MLHLLNESAESLAAWCTEHGVPRYRAAQIRRWLFAQRADSFDAMTDLPLALRSELAEAFAIWTTRIAAHQQSDDGTEKLLLELADAERIECVLLRDSTVRRTICISTQVGCPMGCAFCASGLDGLVRNLTAGEIVEQMLRLQRLLSPDERLSHVVVMGMGEPLANLDALLAALASATRRDGLGISARRITISTVGLTEAMRRLARLDCPYHLAVSLHAADDALRSKLVPSNRKTGVAAIVAAADEYFAVTGRRVTYEYVLLGGVNDQDDHARRLAALVGGRPALVNLIPFNPIAEPSAATKHHASSASPERWTPSDFQPPQAGDVARFAEMLRRAGLAVQIRHRKGERIDAACGQLRRRAAGKN